MKRVDNFMRLCVLLCTYNRPVLFERALRSLVVGTQEKPAKIVVVNGGDDYSDRVVQSFSAYRDVDIQLIKTTNKNLAASRNIGLPHCEGDIIAMTDDDAEVFPDWVTQMKRAHRDYPSAGAVGGPVLGTNTDTWVGRVADLVTFPIWPEARTVRTLPGVNISYKREVIESVGFQDETLFRGEDVDYNWRVKQLGYDIIFDPAIRVHHHHRPTLRELVIQHFMYGRAYVLVRHKWPDMYCIYPTSIRQPKALLKAINFLAMPVYQPILNLRRIESWPMRFRAIPLLSAVEWSWRIGMITQITRMAISNKARR